MRIDYLGLNETITPKKMIHISNAIRCQEHGFSELVVVIPHADTYPKPH
jgi:hypothetical protein